MKKLILILLLSIGTVFAQEAYLSLWWPNITNPLIVAHNVYCSEWLSDDSWGADYFVTSVPMPENQLILSTVQLTDGDFSCYIKSVDFRGRESNQSDSVYLSILGGTVLDFIDKPKPPQAVQLR